MKAWSNMARIGHDFINRAVRHRIRRLWMMLCPRAIARERSLVVPSGGRTGLSAAAVAVMVSCMSFDRMNEMKDFNATTEPSSASGGDRSTANFATDHDLYYPVDFASAAQVKLGAISPRMQVALMSSDTE